MIPTSQNVVVLNNNGVEAIKTIEGNKKNYNKRDIKYGHPIDAIFHHTIMINGIKNSPFYQRI